VITSVTFVLRLFSKFEHRIVQNLCIVWRHTVLA